MFRRASVTKSGRISPIQALILLQLRKQPMYGYEILKSIREQFKNVWEPKTGTVYPALRTLETRGLVQTELKEEKEFYSLTDKGNEILKDADGLLEGSLEFANRYYRFLPPHHRGRIREKMMKRYGPLFQRFFPLFPLDEVENKEERLKRLKMVKEFVQKRLQAIDEEIKKLQT